MIEYRQQQQEEIFFNERISHVTQELITLAFDNLKVLHEDPQFPDRKYYHNRSHSYSVLRRSLQYLDIVEQVHPELLTPGIHDCVCLAGAYHDYLQRYQVRTYEKGGKERKQRFRLAWLNEIGSVEQAVMRMDQANRKSGDIVYTYDQMKDVASAIEITTPSWDPVNNTVFQANLNLETGLIARIIAAADIGAAAIDGPETAKMEADRLLLEDNLDLSELLLGVAERNPLTWEEAASEIRQWTWFQVKYLQGRKNRLEFELDGLSEELKRNLKDRLFIHLDESIEYMSQLATERDMTEDEQLFEEFRQYL